MLEAIKKYKHYITIVSTFIAAGSTLFYKIDAYAQGKVDAGVEALRNETDRQINKVKTDVEIIKVKQAEQDKKIDDIKESQSDIIHLLLEMKKTKDGGK